MPGTLLLAEAAAAKRIALRAALGAAFYDVVLAESLAEARAQARARRCDVALIAQELPDARGPALLRDLKAEGALRDVPLLTMIPPARDEAAMEQRIALLEAGAADVITTPPRTDELLARLRALLRARDAAEELRLRDGTDQALGFAEPAAGFDAPAEIGLVGPQEALMPLGEALTRCLPAAPRMMSAESLLRGAGRVPEVLTLWVGPRAEAGALELLPELRTRPETRHAAIVVLLPEGACHRAASALDLGANDAVCGPVDPRELALRLRLQVRRKRTADRLRAGVRSGLRAAVTDALTGLYNRRYAMPHLARLLERAAASGRPCAVMMADLDHFKRVNDAHGHAAGDAVLVEVARRLRDGLRPVDLLARIGGEEFLLVLPDCPESAALAAAERLRRLIGAEPFALGAEPGPQLRMSASFGVTLWQGDRAALPGPEAVLNAADRALYRAKAEGRDCVALGRLEAAAAGRPPR